MSAVDELRRMLDERGAEWYEAGGVTFFGTSGYGTRYAASEPECGIALDPLTPEQAIAATMGRKTCHIEVRDNMSETDGMGDVWLECDECHWQMPLEPTTPRFKYCPRCGRKVIQ